MGQSVFPAPAAGKTRYAISLTSGTSWTVPANVNYINVTLIGGGGGSGSGIGTDYTGASGNTGGTTTFTGATSATGGAGLSQLFSLLVHLDHISDRLAAIFLR